MSWERSGDSSYYALELCTAKELLTLWNYYCCKSKSTRWRPCNDFLYLSIWWR